MVKSKIISYSLEREEIFNRLEALEFHVKLLMKLVTGNNPDPEKE